MRALPRLLTAAVVLAAVPGAGCGSTPRPPAPPSSPLAGDLRPDVERRLGAAPSALAAAGDRLWVAYGSPALVEPRDAVTGRRAGRAVRLHAPPVALAADAGRAWVALADGRVHTVDGRSGAVRGTARVPAAGGLAVAAGRAWVTSRSQRTLTSVDASGRSAGRPVSLPAPPGAVVARGRELWVALPAAGSVVRVDAATGRAERPRRIARRQVLGLTAGPSGVWAAGTDDPLAERIDVSRVAGGAPARASYAGGLPVRLATAGDVLLAAGGGRIASPALRPALHRFGAAGEIGRALALQGAPVAVVPAGGRVWVLGAGGATLRALRPGPR